MELPKIDLGNLTIDEYTTPCPVSVNQTAPISEVVEIMQSDNIRHVPVISGNRAVGVISDRDLKNLDMLDGLAERITAYDLVRDQTPFTVKTGSLLSNTAFEMSRKKVGSAIITDNNGRIQGIITTTDMLNALIEVMRELEQ